MVRSGNSCSLSRLCGRGDRSEGPTPLITVPSRIQRISDDPIDAVGWVVEGAVRDAEKGHARSVCHSGQKAIRFYFVQILYRLDLRWGAGVLDE